MAQWPDDAELEAHCAHYDAIAEARHEEEQAPTVPTVPTVPNRVLELAKDAHAARARHARASVFVPTPSTNCARAIRTGIPHAPPAEIMPKVTVSKPQEREQEMLEWRATEGAIRKQAAGGRVSASPPPKPKPPPQDAPRKRRAKPAAKQARLDKPEPVSMVHTENAFGARRQTLTLTQTLTLDHDIKTILDASDCDFLDRRTDETDAEFFARLAALPEGPKAT